MSECKHEFETVSASYYLTTKKQISEQINKLNFEEKDAVVTICRHCERLKSDVERDELQAQVAMLRKGMEFIADTTSHKRAVQLAIRFVATTPSEAAERVQKVVWALNDCRNLISKTEFPTVTEQADKALAEWNKP